MSVKLPTIGYTVKSLCSYTDVINSIFNLSKPLATEISKLLDGQRITPEARSVLGSGRSSRVNAVYPPLIVLGAALIHLQKSLTWALIYVKFWQYNAVRSTMYNY